MSRHSGSPGPSKRLSWVTYLALPELSFGLITVRSWNQECRIHSEFEILREAEVVVEEQRHAAI